MSQRYVIGTPTLVVQTDGRTPITIPCGSIIEVPEPLNGLRGLIKVRFNGETVLMFAEDIQERGILVSCAAG